MFAKRGCNEVVSCLHHYINTKIHRIIKNLDLFCDGCRGQNHGNAMVRFLFSLVFRGNFEKITLHLSVRGHSFLPGDRHFGVFEQMKWKKDTAQHYKEWEELIQTTEVESRTQGSRPRPRTQKKSEAKAKDSLSEDRTSRGQGQECSRPRTKDTAASVLQKKGRQKSFPDNLQFKGVARIFDWGDLNHKSHAMTSSKICLLFT